MAININANMALGSAQYLDARQSVATLDALLALDTNIIPNGFECYVEALDCKYKYHEDYNEDSTGNWKLIGEIGVVKNYLRLKGTVGYEPQIVEITPSLVQSVLTNATSETIEGRWILEEAETNTEIFDTDGNFSLPVLEKVTVTKLDDFKVLGVTDITSTAISCRAIVDIDTPFEIILEWKEENGAGHIELTQAEYDALSDEEKLNGTIYFITDAIGGGDEVELIEYAYSIVEPAGSFSIYYSYEDLATKIGCYVPVTTYNHRYGEWVVNIYVVRQNDEGNIEIINESGYETIIAPIGTGTVVTLPFVTDTRASSQTTWSSKQIASALLGDDQLNEFSNNSVQNWVLAGKFKEIESKLDGENGIATYSSLEELGLTAPVTVGDIFNAMPSKSMAVIACEGIEGDTSGADVHVSDVPVSFGVLTIKKNQHSRFSIEYQNSLAGAPCNVKRWIGTLKGNDGTGLYWKEVAYKDDIATYKSLSELGLDTTATLKDITRAMVKNSMIAIKVDAMANQSEYNNITQGTVTIYKIEDARIQAIMTNKVDGRTWVGILGGENTIIGWKELRSDSPFHRVITQGVAGYFKFKPTSNGIDQSLRISVTDNYGGMINISGAKPTASQYKPFKCIRLSYGEYSNYDAMKLANNKMLKLFYYDGYCYLKVTTYTTCTFTGLIEAPTYVETFEETDAEEIPIRSVFDIPYHDGYADPSIICIGDTASGDGIIKTLDSLGFTEDIMTWDTGAYRVSHVGGLTNFPAEITEEKPGFRLEHYDVKKWGGNHNPNVSTYGCRQSVLHYKGNIFVRYTESGANAGVLTTDTGWQKLSKTVIIDKLADLGLTAPCTTVQIANALKGIKPQNNVAIAIIDCSPSQVSDVPADYGLLHIETVGYDRILIRFEGIGSSAYKGSWIGKVIGGGGTFSGVTWERTDNMYSTGEIAIGTWIDGSTIYRTVVEFNSVEAKTSESEVQVATNIPVATPQKVIRMEGFVNLIGNQFYIHYPNITCNDNTIKATVNIANGNVKLKGTWKYPIGKGALILEYTK